MGKQKQATKGTGWTGEGYPFRTLPDYLQPGLDLVFVGINPGLYSVQRRHYFDFLVVPATGKVVRAFFKISTSFTNLSTHLATRALPTPMLTSTPWRGLHSAREIKELCAWLI